MITPKDKKIAIFGSAGSGKTTLAFQLHKRLGLSLYHLDQYCWKPGWEKVDKEIFIEAHHALCDQPEWIIEGSYTNLLYYRLMHANVIIYLDVPRYKCMWHVLKRAIMHQGKEIPGSPAGCTQRIFSLAFFNFLKWVWQFNKRNKNIIRLMLDELKDELKDEKKIFVLKSIDEADCLL